MSHQAAAVAAGRAAQVIAVRGPRTKNQGPRTEAMSVAWRIMSVKIVKI